MKDEPTLILASNSPRRRQLLALGGWTFTVLVADIDESQLPGEAPGDYVLRLAETKARVSASNLENEAIIIAADTTVVEGNEILGKPVDEQDAVSMLKRLRGHTHQVYTGLALFHVGDGELRTDLIITDVPMRAYSDEEIEAYVRTGDPLDKAGAYAIQHPKFQPVETLTGCYASVMGLPLCRVTHFLGEFGVPPKADASVRCQAELQYPCSISHAAWRGELV